MKRWILALVAVGLVAGGAGTLLAGPKKGDTITVRVFSAKLMAEPKFIGKTVVEVSRGEFLTFEDKKRAWYQVKTSSGKTGWIHKSSVVDKKIELSSEAGQSGGTSQEEIELAGRGFTPEVEDEYRSQHADLDFSHVDNIEKTGVDLESVAKFAAAGGVGGGQ